MSEPNDRPKVRLRRASTVLPPVTVDCSHWPRAEGSRARVKLQSAAQHFPLPDDKWLEIRVRFEADAQPAAVEAVTVKLIEAVHATAPELGLTYNQSRSRVDGEDVVVALTPANPAGAKERLAALIRDIRAALADRNGAALTDVRLCPAA